MIGFKDTKGGDLEGQIAFNKKQTPETTPNLKVEASEGGTNTILFCLRYSTSDARFNPKEHARMFGEDIYLHLDAVHRFIESRGVHFDTLGLEVLYSGGEDHTDWIYTYLEGSPEGRSGYFFNKDNPEGAII